MGQLKKISRQGVTFLTYKMDRTQSLDEKRVLRLTEHSVKGIIPFALFRKGSLAIIEWGLEGMVSLKEYLSLVPLTRKIFSNLIHQLIEIIYLISEKGLDLDHLLFDLDYTMIYPANCELEFVYIPVASFSSEKTIKSFLSDIICISEYSVYEENDYIKELLPLINSYNSISIRLLERYYESIRISSSANSQIVGRKEEKIRCSHCQFLVDQSKIKCPICGSFLEHGEFASIINKRTGERIYLNTSPFLIGKIPEGNHYYIKGNNHISRQHVMIVNEGRRFYLIDLNSTNGTSVNQERIIPQIRKELFEGDIIYLADEAFVFSMM